MFDDWKLVYNEDIKFLQFLARLIGFTLSPCLRLVKHVIKLINILLVDVGRQTNIRYKKYITNIIF